MTHYFKTAMLAAAVFFSACSKDDTNNTPDNASTPSDSEPLTTEKQKLEVEGSISFTSGIGYNGAASASYTVVFASYGEYTDADPNTNRVNLLFMKGLTDPTDVLNFYFDGKAYPASGTYEVAGILDNGGMVAPGKVVVSKGALMSTADGGTIHVVNNNGEVTITASEIKLYTQVANGYVGSLTNVNLKKTNTKL
jgi:hypothetical protein